MYISHQIKRKLKHFRNKIRGIPIDWDLSFYEKILTKINTIDLTQESDSHLKERSTLLRKKAPLSSLLVEAYALVREAAKRIIGLRPFDVQVLAAIALYEEKVVEMNTGEGKTLVAVMPAYLNALTGKGVHILTFNDYLARRDASWMGPIYEFLGLKVGYIQEGMTYTERKKAYQADITYATAKEAGFDYLRDSLCYRQEYLVHRDFNLAIVDEADSIMIDEARIPLVIAGLDEVKQAQPEQLAQLVKGLKEGRDFEVDRSRHQINLTDNGLQRIEHLLGVNNLFAAENVNLLTMINLALQAEYILRSEIDYIIRSGQIEIIDEFTGRVVKDRHWPEGLQAAVEAKENLGLGKGGKILGSITLQHFLQLYPKLSGMTATAQPAAKELFEFYGLRTVPIPTHRPSIRIDFPDFIFTHREAKLKALVKEIKELKSKGRPVLVGTTRIEESEDIASALRMNGVECQVLNAKNEEQEAEIISQAGRVGAVTISTNMAGRGTDIKLGGSNEEERQKVVNLGGLYVIGTNRHESLRIDYQLRGRAGRQGDPGSSRFFISLEDKLIQDYGIRNLLPRKYKYLKQEASIEDNFVRREIARVQRIIEGRNFDVRKTLWKYSSLLEEQRKLIHKTRCQILKNEYSFQTNQIEIPEGNSGSEKVQKENSNNPGSLNKKELFFSRRIKTIRGYFFRKKESCQNTKIEHLDNDRGKQKHYLSKIKVQQFSSLKPGFLAFKAPSLHQKLVRTIGEKGAHEVEKNIMLSQIDRFWASHLAQVAEIRESIHLVSVAGLSPIDEFVKIINQEFLRLEERIQTGIFNSYCLLPWSEIEKEKTNLKPEAIGTKDFSSTWTYLVEDNKLGPWVGLLQGQNIGFTASAAAAYGPLYLALVILYRHWLKIKNGLRFSFKRSGRR